MNELRLRTALVPLASLSSSVFLSLFLATGSLRTEEAAAKPAEVDQPTVPTPHLGLGVPADCIAYLRLEPSNGWNAFRKDVDALFSEVTAESVVSWLLNIFPAGEERQLNEKDRKARAENVRGEVAHWVNVFASVEWRRLIAREWAIGLRYELLDTELLALFRVDPAERGRLAGQIARVLEEIAARGGDFEMIDSPRFGIATIVVQSRSDPAAQICIGGLSDVVAVASSTKLLRQSLRLLSGEAQSVPMVMDDAYERTLGVAGKDQRDFELLVKPAKYFDNLRQELNAIEEALADVDEIELPETVKMARERGRRLVNGLDFIDGLSVKASLVDNKLSSQFALELRDRTEGGKGAAKAEIRQPLFPDRPLAKRGAFTRIGADAVVAWTGFEYRSLVSGLVEVFGGDKIEGTLQADLLDLLDGELFAAGKTKATPPVIFVEVADGKKATATLRMAIDRFTASPEELPFVHSVKELGAEESGGASGFRAAVRFSADDKEDFQLGVQDKFLFLAPPGQTEFAAAAAKARASGSDFDEGLHAVWDLDLATLVRWIMALGRPQQEDPVGGAVVRGLGFLDRLTGSATRSGNRYEGKATLTVKKGQF